MGIDHPAGGIIPADRTRLFSEPAAGMQGQKTALQHDLDLFIDVGMVTPAARAAWPMELGTEHVASLGDGLRHNWQQVRGGQYG